MTNYLLNHLILAGWNVLNSYVDAYLIMRHKTIAHAVNFVLYAAVVGMFCITQEMAWYDTVLLCVSAFCNRQGTFDISLNLRRGLKWDYVSTAKPPKALLDWVEIRIFGYNGRAPVLVYAAIFILCTLLKFLV
jgi:hypothetical protein